MPLWEFDRSIDDLAAELSIWPWQTDRFQPAELFALQRGQQRVWNRQCLLTAWSTYIIARTFGAFERMDFPQFLKSCPPPGYDPKA